MANPATLIKDNKKYHRATQQGSEGCQAFANPTPMTTTAQSTTSATAAAVLEAAQSDAEAS